MKKLTIFLIAIFAYSFAVIADARMMGVGSSDEWEFDGTQADWDEIVEHTLREELEGKDVWNKLQAGEIFCADLSDEQFGVLGEYFMGQMAGESHAAMNAMITQMHGEKGEEQIHIVIGRRMSVCDPDAEFPSAIGGWMPMMNMMWGGPLSDRTGWSSLFDGNNSINNMMNFGFGYFSWFGFIFMILWWVLIIAAIVALIKWLINQFHGYRENGKSALEILRERYVKGEIDKKEFEEKKRDLNA